MIANIISVLMSGGTSGGSTPPIIQASDIVFSDVLDDRFTISWTKNADYTLVAIREDEAVNDVPIDGIVYDPNTVLGTGDEVGAYNWVVYDGAGTSVTVTGLTANKTYHVRLFSHTGTTEPNTVYNVDTATDNPLSQLTEPEPAIILAILTANETSFNPPNSERMYTAGSISSSYIDASNYTQCRLEVYVSTPSASVNSPRVYPGYSLNDGSTWTGIGTGLTTEACSIASGGRVVTDWIDLPTPAKTFAKFYFMENGGDGSIDPILQKAFLSFR